MRKAVIRNETIKKETIERDGALYTYTLCMSEGGNVANYMIPLYSVEIEMTDPDGNETSASTKEIFADVGKALVFYRRMVDNLATPANLPYIVQDEIH